jgi:hypothetical protein
MITTRDILTTAILPAVVAILGFLFLMLYFRKVNFNSDGTRRNDWRKLSPELLTQQIEYHNNAIYRAFEFYVKVLLAIFGGIAYVATRIKTLTPRAKSLIDAGGWVVLATSFLFVALIISHQRAKIERWQRRYDWLEVLSWNECWFVCSAVGLALFTTLTVVPMLIK